MHPFIVFNVLSNLFLFVRCIMHNNAVGEEMTNLRGVSLSVILFLRPLVTLKLSETSMLLELFCRINIVFVFISSLLQLSFCVDHVITYLFGHNSDFHCPAIRVASASSRSWSLTKRAWSLAHQLWRTYLRNLGSVGGGVTMVSSPRSYSSHFFPNRKGASLTIQFFKHQMRGTTTCSTKSWRGLMRQPRVGLESSVKMLTMNMGGGGGKHSGILWNKWFNLLGIEVAPCLVFTFAAEMQLTQADDYHYINQSGCTSVKGLNSLLLSSCCCKHEIPSLPIRCGWGREFQNNEIRYGDYRTERWGG